MIYFIPIFCKIAVQREKARVSISEQARGKCLTSIQTNTFCDFDKYILKFAQIPIQIDFIAGSGKKVDLNPFHILLPEVKLGRDVLDLNQFHTEQYFCISKLYF